MRNIFFLLLFITASAAAQERADLVPFRDKNKWGYADRKGNIVIPPQFDSTCFFFSEEAPMPRAGKVVIGFKFNLVNKQGKLLLPDAYDDVIPYTWGYMAVQYGGKVGAFDASGKLFIPFKYQDVYQLKPGIFRVHNGGKDGVVNAKGVEIIPVDYDHITLEGDEIVAMINDEGKVQTKYFDLNGKPKSRPKETRQEAVELLEATKIYDESREMERISQYRIITRDGRRIVIHQYNKPGGMRLYYDTLPGSYDSLITLYHESDILFAKNNGKWALLSGKGKMKTDYLYDDINVKSPVYKLRQVIVQQNGKWGIIDTSGLWLLNPAYDRIESPQLNFYYFLYCNGKMGFWVNDLNSSTKQTYLVDCSFDQLYRAHLHNNEIFIVALNKEGRHGFVDMNGITYFRD